MTVIQQNNLNTSNLTVPDLYVQIVPPNALINGLPTSKLGLVGTATWGPVNAQTQIGSLLQYTQTFGAIQAAKYDLGTGVAAATMQGANNICCIRVTDGTDAAATITVLSVTPDTGMTLTANYTGTVGNTINVVVSKGSSYTTSVKTYRITITIPGAVPEIFDNIGGTGLALWTNAVNAINLGQSGIRGPSRFVTATVGTSTGLPAESSYTLAGGANGNTTITGSVLIGLDTLPRKGMYALRNSGCSVVALIDNDDSTTYAAQIAYGLFEGSYMIMTAPAGTAYATTATALQTAAVDSFAGKVMVGDWCYFNDTTNNQLRLISPQGFVAGNIAASSPQNSSLNKPLYGIVATQTSQANLIYTSADLAAISLARLDVITNPVPGGNYFGCRFGRNTSSNWVIHEDNYPRMTNYLAYSLNAVMGQFVGQVNSAKTRSNARAALQAFLSTLVSQNQINAYTVLLAEPTDPQTNNPQNRIALGYLQADIQVQYLSIIEFFIVNMQGGQSVSIQSVAVQPVNQPF